MATDELDPASGKRIVKPKIAAIRFKESEGQLFDSAPNVRNWKLVDKTRRMLADVNRHLSKEMPRDLEAKQVSDLEPLLAQQFAIVGVSSIVARSIGAALAMVSSGYAIEAGSMARRSVEARLNGRAALDDMTGQYAIRVLEGKHGGLGKLAQRYGESTSVELLSRLTHADFSAFEIIGQTTTRKGKVSEIRYNVNPSRDENAPLVLGLLAYECVLALDLLGKAFNVDVDTSPWVAEQLQTLNKEMEEAQENETN